MTDILKMAAICWLRYEKGCDIACTEIGNTYIKDVLGLWINPKDGLPVQTVEVEVKTSISDLHADFRNKPQKHDWYSKGKNAPNYFYFLTPKSLVPEASVLIRRHSTKYGLLSLDAETALNYGPFALGKMLKSELRVQRICDDRPLPALMHQMGRRLMNEYVMQKQFIQSRLDNVENDIRHFAKELVKYERGRDSELEEFV